MSYYVVISLRHHHRCLDLPPLWDRRTLARQLPLQRWVDAEAWRPVRRGWEPPGIRHPGCMPRYLMSPLSKHQCHHHHLPKPEEARSCVERGDPGAQWWTSLVHFCLSAKLARGPPPPGQVQGSGEPLWHDYPRRSLQQIPRDCQALGGIDQGAHLSGLL